MEKIEDKLKGQRRTRSVTDRRQNCPVVKAHSKHKNKVLVISLEEIELLSDEEMIAAHLEGALKLKPKTELGSGLDYIVAKKASHKRKLSENQQPKPGVKAGFDEGDWKRG